MNRILIILSFFVLPALLTAQNRKIEFTEDYSAALVKAKAENKIIFMDCFTTWCGPCKMLAAQIFTQDAVADYFNTHFVNVKMDMEKGEGPALARKYSVGSYPTLIFVDGDGEEMHRTMGFMPAEKLLGEVAHVGDELLEGADRERRRHDRCQVQLRRSERVVVLEADARWTIEDDRVVRVGGGLEGGPGMFQAIHELPVAFGPPS